MGNRSRRRLSSDLQDSHSAMPPPITSTYLNLCEVESQSGYASNMSCILSHAPIAIRENTSFQGCDSGGKAGYGGAPLLNTACEPSGRCQITSVGGVIAQRSAIHGRIAGNRILLPSQSATEPGRATQRMQGSRNQTSQSFATMVGVGGFKLRMGFRWRGGE